jgi:hypothetical protein
MFFSLFFTALLLLFSPMLSANDTITAKAQHIAFTASNPANMECFKSMRTAIPVLYREDAGATIFNARQHLYYAIPAHNDMMCTDPEWMMNAVVTVQDADTKEAWYGIFHIHVLPDGTFKSATSFSDTRWKAYNNPAEWQTAWCDDIRTVYPEDYKAQCMAKP